MLIIRIHINYEFVGMKTKAFTAYLKVLFLHF